ncbi:hypothetical protein Tco_0439663 [Tanacetum coccineum]
MPGPEHPPLPDYVLGPKYLEYLVSSDDEVPIEDQPLPVDASPTALSPGYVADSDLDKDPEEDPADYPADGGDDGEEESSEDDNDEEEEEASEEDKDEEDEHLAPANSATLPAIDPVPSAENTEAFETDESAATPPPPPQTIVPVSVTRHHRARISVRPHTPPSPSTKAFIVEFAYAPIPPLPPPSPLSPISSPLLRIPSPPLHTSPTYVEAPLGYKAAMIPLRAASPLPVPSPPLFEVGESSAVVAARQAGHTLAHRVDYGFIDTVDASIRASESRVLTAVEEVNKRVTDLATTQGQDAHELYMRCEDAQDDRDLLRAQDEVQRQQACDMVTSAFGRIYALEARDRARPDDLEDTGSSC